MAPFRQTSVCFSALLHLGAIYGVAIGYSSKVTGNLARIRPSVGSYRNVQRLCALQSADNFVDLNVEDSSFVQPIDRSQEGTSRVAKGSTPEFAIEGDSIVETPMQRAVVMTHFILATVNLILANSAMQLNTPMDLLGLAYVIGLSVVLGDFGTGVFHWSVDNYGSIKTPVFGTVCAAFQGHHVTPWTITFRGFANNVYKICYGTIPALVLLMASSAGPLTRVFFTLFITWWMISQELHKYSHMRTTPRWAKALQDAGIILSKKEHGLHHTSPFEGHYCILTGVCNEFLDRTNFFRFLEVIVFRLTGNKPNTWKEDPSIEEKWLRTSSSSN